MATYHAEVVWSRNGQAFTDNKYSRAHEWRFDQGVVVPAAASSHIVPLPYTTEAAVDPEEAFVASLSSCHMLWFLSLAAAKGFRVDSYSDAATGVMAKNAEGRLAMTILTLRPDARFSGERRPSAEEVHALHHAAHEECFIANSVRSEVRCEPVVHAAEHA